MSDSTPLSLNQLPVEILHGILHYLDIPDILRIRRVSRYLNGVSHSRDVWSDAYRKADFVRPPGPFISQSAHDLENALVPSFRVDRNLRHGGTAQREKQALSLRQIRYTGLELHVSLVFGRFLLIAFKEEVRCYDLNLDAFDSNSGASIIYRPTGAILKSFHCVSAIDVEGCPFACAVFSEAMQAGFPTRETTQISIHSLKVVEQSELALDLLHQFEHNAFDVDVVDLGPRVLVIHGRVGPDVDADWRLIALDVHARTQFLLSSFTHATWEGAEVPGLVAIEEITSPTSISTSTHLLLARSFYTQAAGWSTFLQAFTLPHPSTHHHVIPPSTPLSPSHRGIIPGISIRDTALLHDAVIETSTQDILITIRVAAFEPSRPRFSLSKYGVLRLGTAHPHDDKLGTIAFRLLGSLFKFSRTPFLHPSFNGTGRAFYTLGTSSSEVAMLEYDVRGDGGIDDHPEAKIIEYPSILWFSIPRELLDYDPYAGRICLRFVPMAKYRVIEIFDIAV